MYIGQSLISVKFKKILLKLWFKDVKVVTNNGDIETGDRPLMLRLETKSVQLESSEKEVASLNQEIRELKLSFSAKEEELLRTVEEKNLYQQKVAEMEQEVDRIRRSLLSVQGRVGHGIVLFFSE